MWINYENDDEERDIYLKELGNSIQNYIKTGVKNQRLEELIKLEEEFQQKYKVGFDVKEIAKDLSNISIDKRFNISEKYCKDLKDDKDEKINIFNEDICKLIDEYSNQIIENLVESISEKLIVKLKNAAYLSHVNMIYELYEKEEKLRREEKEYKRKAEKYHKMANITEELFKQKRIEIKVLENQTNIPINELKEILNHNEKYFNVRNRGENVEISLSPQGKKYNIYINCSKNTYSSEVLNQIVYKNCINLMEALENSYNRGIEYEFKLEKIEMEKDLALHFKYNRFAQKLISEREERYIIPSEHMLRENREREEIFIVTSDNRLRVNREREDDENEKNCFRIQREWNL